MTDSSEINAANIPIVLVSNPLPGKFVTCVGADDFEIGYREARYLFEHLGGKGKIVMSRARRLHPPTASARGYQKALAEFPGIELLAPARQLSAARCEKSHGNGRTSPSTLYRPPTTAWRGVLEALKAQTGRRS
jgi:ribose transport system substrate-binding protein